MKIWEIGYINLRNSHFDFWTYHVYVKEKDSV